MAAVKQAEHDVSYYMRSFVVSMKDCVGQLIACTRASDDQPSWTIMEVFRNAEKALHDIMSSHCFSDDSLFHLSCIFTSCDGLMLLWIDKGPYGGSPDALSSDKTQTTRSLRSLTVTETPPKCST